jgi:hypothetical protein
LVLYELLDLAEQHVEAADQTQVAHDRAREVADDVLVVRFEHRFHYRLVALPFGVDVAEDDVPLLFRAELLDRRPFVRKRRHVQVVQVLVLAVDARSEHRQFDVEPADVLVLVLRIHLDDDRALRPGASARDTSARPGP